MSAIRSHLPAISQFSSELPGRPNSSRPREQRPTDLRVLRVQRSPSRARREDFGVIIANVAIRGMNRYRTKVRNWIEKRHPERRHGPEDRPQRRVLREEVSKDRLQMQLPRQQIGPVSHWGSGAASSCLRLKRFECAPASLPAHAIPPSRADAWLTQRAANNEHVGDEGQRGNREYATGFLQRPSSRFLLRNAEPDVSHLTSCSARFAGRCARTLATLVRRSRRRMRNLETWGRTSRASTPGLGWVTEVACPVRLASG